MDQDKKHYCVYILSCSDGSLYTGITTDLQRRLGEHNSGQGAAYTASRTPVALLAAWRFPNRSQATRAEHAMKRRSRASKFKAVEQAEPFQGGKPVPDGNRGA